MEKNWGTEEKTQMFLHSIKAFDVCGEVKKVFNLCRASPFGGVVDPSYCKNHAEVMLDCFEEVKQVPGPCKAAFDSAVNCLQNKGYWNTCEEEITEYEECPHPAQSKYSGYEQGSKIE
mmetsp:Transcript_2431/g.3841  ORF Transcript_2431/g.3841 Transcript_2431/m.3841 type:complete len:118 (+) Transcript_2431:71-424(+)